MIQLRVPSQAAVFFASLSSLGMSDASHAVNSKWMNTPGQIIENHHSPHESVTCHMNDKDYIAKLLQNTKKNFWINIKLEYERTCLEYLEASQIYLEILFRLNYLYFMFFFVC